MGLKKVCPVCGTEFVATSYNQKFCTKQCYYKANYENRKKDKKRYIDKLKTEGVKKKCKYCGKEFITNGYGLYCSEECKLEFTKNIRANARYKKTCAICGKEFISNSHVTKCCSDECKAKNKQNWQKNYRDKTYKERKKSRFNELSREARERGLSYGQLQAIKAGLIQERKDIISKPTYYGDEINK